MSLTAEQDFSKRLVILVRTDLLGWEAANAVAHISAYIGNQLGASFGTGDAFRTADGESFPRNSQYPMIIKGAASSSDLQEALAKAREGAFMHIAFIREMIETNSDAEIEGVLSKKQGAELELLGLGIFGGNEEMKLLTKAFPLWK